ncbi:hypothetical protein J6590_042782 [Homalodisca vitripennis]|nr:hypothetical protein J6590_042782 [Homalodisca vitripennis]
MLGRVAERCVKLELKHQRDKVPATNRFNSDSVAWLWNGRCRRNPEDRHAGPRSRAMREHGYGTEDVAGIQRPDMLGRVAERCVKLELKHQRDKVPATNRFNSDSIAWLRNGRCRKNPEDRHAGPRSRAMREHGYRTEDVTGIQRTDMLGRVAERCVKLELKHQRDEVPATIRFNIDSIAWLWNGRCRRNPEDRHAGPRGRAMREVGTETPARQSTCHKQIQQ